jgi:membrane protein YqaA with SNARE-associated domain
MPIRQRAGEWLERLNRSQHALWLIGVMSFLETIIVPIPMEVVLIPFMAANRRRIWLIASVTLAGCVIASLLGYGVGMLLYQSAGTWFIEAMGYEQAYEGFRAFFDQHGFLAILVVGIVPIPFQVAMITAGLSGYPLPLFVLATLIARGIRYYGLAWLVARFGSRAKQVWREHALLASVGAAALIAGVVLVGDYLASLVI